MPSAVAMSHDAVGIGIVAERGRVSDVEPGARQIDGGIESVARRRPTPKRPSAAARQFDLTSPMQTTRGFCSVMHEPYQDRRDNGRSARSRKSRRGANKTKARLAGVRRA